MSDFSPYSYVRNRPLNYVDLYGLDQSPAGDFWEEFKDEFNKWWDSVWSPANGGGGGGGSFGGGGAPGFSSYAGSTSSYLNNYRSPSGGRWIKQYYGTGVGNDPIAWQGYDWVWVPGFTDDYGWAWQSPGGKQGYGVYSREYLERIAFRTPPMRNTAPNPYPHSYRYLGISGRQMFWVGGNGPWGQTARGILNELYQIGVDPALAHDIAYRVADQRTSDWQRIWGQVWAHVAAFLLNAREMEGIDRSGRPDWWINSGSNP